MQNARAVWGTNCLFPPTLHACTCVHKLILVYVHIQSFIRPSLNYKALLFLLFLGLKILNTLWHRSDRQNGKCLTPTLTSSQGLLTGNKRWLYLSCLSMRRAHSRGLCLIGKSYKHWAVTLGVGVSNITFSYCSCLLGSEEWSDQIHLRKLITLLRLCERFLTVDLI